MQQQDACPAAPAADVRKDAAAPAEHEQGKSGCVCADPAFIAKLYPDVQRLLRKSPAAPGAGRE
jgi:hypothetical protein